MTADKIIISFDDTQEPENQNPDKLKLEIELNTPAQVPSPAPVEKISSFPYGDRGYTLNSNSPLDFPSGIERGFGVSFSLDLKHNFINSLIESSEYIITASVDGFINLIDKATGNLSYTFFFENERFEKAGVVIDDIIYINSIKKVYFLDSRFRGNDSNNLRGNTPSVIPAEAGIHTPSVIYSAPDDFFIWSSLNEFNCNIIFTIYSPSQNIAHIITLTQNGNADIIFSFNPVRFVSGEILASSNSLFTLFDDKICIFNNNSQTLIQNNYFFSYDVFAVLINDDLFFNSPSGEIYTININSSSLRFTGIKTSVINSIAASGNVLFIGTSSGWSAFNKNGFEIFSHIDVDKNTLLSLGNNILTASAGNKILFFNTAKFAEAQLFSLKDDIVSARVSHNSVFVLTKSGILQSFKNNMLIIHI